MRLHTSTDLDHYHVVVIDKDGDGNTILTEGRAPDHDHEVVGGIVMGSDIDNHVHFIDTDEKE